MADEKTQSNPIKALLIEDDPDDIRLIQLTLADGRPHLVRLEIADRLLHGCQRLANGGIDVVLLDLSLPDSQGLDALAKVQAAAPDVPVVVLAGMDDGRLGLEAIDRGAQDYLVKGQADHSVLIRALRYAISRKRGEKVLRKERDRIQQYLDIAGVMFVAIDTNQAITLINRRGCEILGYDSPDDLVGKNWFDLCLPAGGKAGAITVFTQLMAGQIEPVEYVENPVLTRSGSERMIAWHNTIVKDDIGNIAGSLSSGEDITGQKQAEEALRESEERYRLLVDKSPYAIGIHQDGKLIFANPAAVRLLGAQNAEDLAEKPIRDIVHPDGWEAGDNRLQRLLQGETDLYPAEDRYVRLDGSVVSVETIVIPFIYRGRPAIQVIALDISERKHAAEALLHERSLLQTLMDNAPDLIYFKDAASRFTRINQAEARLLGVDNPEEVIGKTDFDYQWEHVAQDAFAEEQHIVETGQPVLDRAEFNPLPDGSPRWLANTKVPIRDEQGQITGIVGISRDITQRKRSEEALTQYARQLLLINDISRRVTGVMDLDDLLNTTASLIHESFDYEHVGIFIVDKRKEDELIMKARAGLYASRFPPDHRLKLGQGMIGWVALYGKKLLANDVTTEMRFHDPFGDGSIKAELSVPIPSELSNVGVIDIQSRQKDAFNESDVMVVETLAGVLAVAIRNVRLYQELEIYNQILEQAVQEATVEVRRTKERVGAILDNSADVILLLRSNGTIEAGNPTFQELFGCHVDDLYGQPLTSLAEPGHVEALQGTLQEVIDTRERRRLETVVQRPDGVTVDADIALSPIQEGDTLQGIVCSLRDITALKEVDRMKDAFISNVSHELRTPITGIKLSHRLIGMDPGKQSVYLERMGREIERLHDIIEDLLRLSRLDQGRVVLDIRPLDLNKLTTQYVDDRTPLATTRQLTLLLSQEAGLPLAQADEGLLGQVLSILLTNATHYTPPGGKVTVSTRMGEIEGKKWAGFSVSDTGPGIPVEDLPHLGERFYRGKTGRDSGAPGTGLGLAIAREIVERHHGRMEISSGGSAGAGATFTVWLPTEHASANETSTKR